MKTDKDSDSILTQLIVWLNKQAEARLAESKEALDANDFEKKIDSADLEQAVKILSETLTKCINEVTKVALSLSTTIKAVNEHTAMIEELYTVQTGILQILKSGSSLSSEKLSDVVKKKTEKPN